MQQLLQDGFNTLGLSFTVEMASHFRTYYDYLTEKNAVMNLTAIEGENDTARLHFLDCAALCALHDFSGEAVVDVGTGAGFPGLPLKIAVPEIRLTLLDSHNKRMDFLRETCHRLGFSDVQCISARAEEVAADIGGSFDTAVSRAVARLNILCELCLPFVHVGGLFIAMKGPDCTQELDEAKNAIAVLGGGESEIRKYTVPGTDIVHSAVMIRKLKPTPMEYPRPFGKIKKAPL